MNLSTRRASPLLVAFALAACGGGYRFETRAHYTAPSAGLDISINASGNVASGADLSEQSTADVTIAPVGRGGSALHLKLALPAPGGRTPIAGPLRDAGLIASPAEVEEIDRVIDCALRGPKATLMPGQTRVLRVIDVRFSYP